MTQLTPEMMLEAFPGYGLIVDMSGKIEAISSSFLEIAPMLQVGASLYEFLPLEKNVELKDILKEIKNIGFCAKEIYYQEKLWILYLGRVEGTKTIVCYLRDETSSRKRAEELLHDASIDPLTGLINRRRFFDESKRFFAMLDGETKPFIISFDIDFFKKVNDTWGHAVGDDVLKHVSKIAAGKLRVADILARCGGEEFWIMGRCLTIENSLQVAERIRTAIEASPCIVKHEGKEIPISVTISLGIVYGGTDLREMQNKSDMALYESKRTGRNKSTVWHEELNK